MHYKRVRKNGTPGPAESTYGQPLSRLRNDIATRDRSTGCWEWEFSRKPHGYGQIRIDGRTKNVHQLAVQFDGRDTSGKIVRHSCDNPPCYNPNHLVTGTAADNIRDMMERGRSGAAKLGESDIIHIRALAAAGETKAHIARLYNVSRTTTTRIINRETWKHL